MRLLTVLVHSVLTVLMLTSGAQGQGSATPSPPRRIGPGVIPEYRSPSDSPEPAFQVVVPTTQAPTGSCKRAMPRVDWLRCLRETAELTDRLVEEVTQKVKERIQSRVDAGAGQKRYWLAGLVEVQKNWTALRELECLRLSPSEPALAKDVYEARLLCAIRENSRRRSDLELRYGIE